MRSGSLLFALPFALAGCATQPPHDAPTPTPPSSAATPATRPMLTPARSQAFSETLFGHTIDDPFRWMEAPAQHDEVVDWLRTIGRQSDAVLSTLPEREALYQELRTTGVRTTVQQVAEVAGRLFYERRLPDESRWTLRIRDAAGDRLLLDPARFDDAGQEATLHNYSVSPDGRTLAFHTGLAGSETGTIRFLDIDRGTLIGTPVGPVWGEFPAVWRDARHAWITRMTDGIDGDPLQAMQVVEVAPGGTPSAPQLGAGAPGNPLDAHDFPMIGTDPGSRWQIGLGSGAGRGGVRMLFRRGDAGDRAWHELAGFADGVQRFALDGDRLYLIVNAGTPNGRLLALTLADDATLADADLLVPESDAVLSSVAVDADGLYLVRTVDGYDRLQFRPRGEQQFVDVALPFPGALSEVGMAAARDPRMVLSLEDDLHPVRWYAVDGTTMTPLALEAGGDDGRDTQYEVLHDQAISADGTQVPMTIIHRRGEAPNGHAPTIVYGYGGYGVSLRPTYLPQRFSWLDRGGIWVNCHTRGGGEKGERWHQGGRGPNKPNGHADLIACGERMVAAGWTRPGAVGGMGVSAGGLLVGPATLARPDLFGFAILAVAELNPTRILAAPNGMNQIVEMGDPREPDGFATLMLADSYLKLAKVDDVPDVLLTVGLHDQRVSPTQAAKFAARYLARHADDGTLLVHVDGARGHIGGGDRDQTAALRADIYAFALDRARRVEADRAALIDGQ